MDREKANHIEAGGRLVKAIRTSVAIAALVVLSAGCLSSPKGALEKFLAASSKGDCKDAYECVSAGDRAAKDLDTWVSECKGGRDKLAEAIAKKSSYEIMNVRKDGKEATAFVKIVSPDMSLLDREPLSSRLAGLEGKERSDAIAAMVESGEIPLETTSRYYQLVKGKGGWKVFMGWENENKVAELMKEAAELEQEGKMYEAKDKYYEVIEITGDVGEASRRLNLLFEKIHDYEDKSEYMNDLDIKYLTMARVKRGGLTVYGQVDNMGDRSLSAVKMIITFVDAAGETVFEETHEISMKSDPLKPDYHRMFGFKITNPNWSKAKDVKARLVDMEFQK